MQRLRSFRPWSAGLGALLLAFGLATGVAPAPAHAQGLPDFTELVEKVGPAVVNIRTTERARQMARPGQNPEIDEDMLEFFRRFGIPIPNRPGPRGQQPAPGGGEAQPRGVGSGFILTADGFVMTNAHVVEGAEDVIVTLADKREFKAKIVGADKRSDVALVKIDASGLPFVRTGDVSRLKAGEWVIAIGSPFGLESTVTAGIVSAKSRDTGDLLPLIQTDVAINPGNSGGPLINMRGEVVGINSQIYSRSGGYMGISFAIPIDEAIRVSEQLRVGGRVIRGRIGVVIDQVTREVAEAIGLGKPTGALVRSVEAGGPADKAGVEAGDIITRVDGRTVESSRDLPRVIGAIKPGTRATLQVFRRGATRDLAVTVAEFEAEQSARATPDKGEGAKPAPVGALGLAVADLTDAQKRELKVKNGVRVESAEGVAARAGLREGDVIMTIDNVEITSARQFAAVTAKLDKSKPVTLLVKRGDAATFLILRPAR
ncbi:DegQ family serine endoprotease [Piscinibacter koreensis]|uniref:Probable periplasmic serine endoprotease DegP-like n=1 Tax=Piscinibacter koreensis TaxID=2742824 RepID=A0A7Y6TXE6_9BURK|nr:DegQ family serine endoprotease [Schlegelella koreensis]NUZ06966.1 DegQ family serine endoprotease [Schlegelella koreensis]